MEYLILGLLALTPMTGYELQQFARQNLSLICSHSAGSVQTALSKLEKQGFVFITEAATGKRKKKIFSITDSGRTTFETWVAQPMQAGRVKNMELAHLFFLGLASPSQRIAAIQNYIEQMEQMRSILCAIRQRFDEICQAIPSDGMDWDTIFRFQGYAIDYGIAAADFERRWYQDLLKKLEETT